ncbi:hypothetical protein BDY17DRAFT_310262 [Neohortaea acidophila]|uniref:Uncharacterized protein n=1 Tax=Neohortaea acidophila TaxID=245834 RepID=A0A6A6PU47_9PEZI|nr:uncharacterized protein BDY17DRAFT_310262 [Neohortaea acidophila]KAF2483211.1 hypothetical protein BDY17DRAFT_310262 [Neohortaea acidophila]
MSKRKRKHKEESESDSDDGGVLLHQSMNTTKTSTEGAEFSRGHVSPLPAPDDLSTMPINAAEPARDGAVTPFGHSSPIPAPDDVSQMPIGEADPPGYTEPEPTSTTTAQCIHPGRKAEISMANCSLCEMHVDKVWQCAGLLQDGLLPSAEEGIPEGEGVRRLWSESGQIVTLSGVSEDILQTVL